MMLPIKLDLPVCRDRPLERNGHGTVRQFKELRRYGTVSTNTSSSIRKRNNIATCIFLFSYFLPIYLILR